MIINFKCFEKVPQVSSEIIYHFSSLCVFFSFTFRLLDSWMENFHILRSQLCFAKLEKCGNLKAIIMQLLSFLFSRFFIVWSSRWGRKSWESKFISSFHSSSLLDVRVQKNVTAVELLIPHRSIFHIVPSPLSFIYHIKNLSFDDVQRRDGKGGF